MRQHRARVGDRPCKSALLCRNAGDREALDALDLAAFPELQPVLVKRGRGEPRADRAECVEVLNSRADPVREVRPKPKRRSRPAHEVALIDSEETRQSLK